MENPEKSNRIEFPVLTPEQINTLQVDAAIRLIGEYTVILTRINKQVRDQMLQFGQAKMKLDELKNDKQTLIELMRAVKVIATQP
ncbi:MAG: hypothetical protein PHI19_06160 [Clostridia bacterium]|nr:hypothetical protein [Clostridia bacterium]